MYKAQLLHYNYKFILIKIIDIVIINQCWSVAVRGEIFKRKRSANIGQEQVFSTPRTDHVPVSLHHTIEDETQRFPGLLQLANCN